MFGEDRGSKLHTAHLAQIIHETHRNVDFCGLLLKQAQTRPAVVPERKQSAGMHVMCCSALQHAQMETRPGGSVYIRLSHACCTNAALRSPNGKQTDCVLCAGGNVTGIRRKVL